MSVTSTIITAIENFVLFSTILAIISFANFRTTFISLMAIPLSLLTAILVMSYFGITVNTIWSG